jgi:hypothetical protein
MQIQRLIDARVRTGYMYVPVGEEDQDVAVDAAAVGLTAAGAKPHGGKRHGLPPLNVLFIAAGEVNVPPQQRLVEGH